MSHLTIYRDDSASHALLDTHDGEQIAAALLPIGVRFERWSASRQLPADVNDAAVMEAYQGDIERLKTECGYQSVDVLRCLPDNPNREQLRTSSSTSTLMMKMKCASSSRAPGCSICAPPAKSI